MISAKVICDSISPMGVRLTTLEVVMPRIVLAEFNTHRMFSRNSASSRAIPVEKMIERVRKHPFVPGIFYANRKGMQGGEALTDAEAMAARNEWLDASNIACAIAERLLGLGVHKQTTNRLLEPFLYHTVIVTATEWSNFFAQRCHPDAMPEMRLTAEAMRDAMDASTPAPMDYGGWHLPYVSIGEMNLDSKVTWEDAKKISVARCARVSYLQHDGTRSIEKDLELFERLQNGMHMSPFEHVATPLPKKVWSLNNDEWSGNFRGWMQFRKQIPNECR